MVQRVSTAQKASRYSTIVWVLLIPAILGFYALQNAGTAKFEVLNTFFIIYLLSGFGLLFAEVRLFRGGRGEDLGVFYTKDIDGYALKWLGIGILSVFASVGLILVVGSSTVGDNVPTVQIAGIAVAGFAMMIPFLKTNAILVPIMIHGVYNAFIAVLQRLPFDVTNLSQQQLDVLPDIPNIGIGLFGQVVDIYSDAIWQFTIVATAEEFLKLAILVGVVWAIEAKWETKNKGSLIVGVIVSVIFWAYLHGVRAIPLGG